MPYNFSHVPEISDVSELRSYLEEELRKISETFNEQDSVELRASHHAPAKPREGMIIHADGTAWNPGSGAGTYRYQAGAWIKVTGNSDLDFLYKKGANVASAGTVTFSDGGYFHVTGTTTITDVDFGTPGTPVDGRSAIVVFDGILTLTHNATTLILPTGANITTAAGDTARFVQDSGDNVKCVWYMRANGTALGATTPTFSINIQTFTANGTYTPTANMKYCILEVWGGGAGGGGSANTAANSVSSGGGGGAGSKALKFASAATIGASQTVTIGAKGTGGAAGNNNGTVGSDSSVGSLCIGKGGSPGIGSNATVGVANNAPGGAGGVAGTGDVAGTGMNGLGSVSSVGSNTGGGQGGSATPVGAGGQHRVTQGTGNAATGKASGGGGGMSINVGGTAAGGDGTDGYVVITEFILA